MRVATFDVGLTRDGAGVLLRDLADPDPTTAAIAHGDPRRPSGRPAPHRLRHRPARPRARRLRRAARRGAGRHRLPAQLQRPGQRRRTLWPRPRRRRADDGLRTTASAGASSPATAAWRSCRGCRSTPRARGPSACCAGPTCRAPNCRCAPTARRSPTRRRRRRCRLSSRSHWDVPVLAGATRLHLLAASPTPPLFDGAEGFNRLRNRDELRLWSAYLDGAALRDDAGREASLSAGPLVLLGNLNLDPFDGAGAHEAIAGLLAHPRLQDPRPTSRGGAAAGPGRCQRQPRRRPGARHRRLARRRPGAGQPAGRLRAALRRSRSDGGRRLLARRGRAAGRRGGDGLGASAGLGRPRPAMIGVGRRLTPRRSSPNLIV